MITVNLASIPSRKEQLINTLNSLLNQTLQPNKINVCLNNYKEIPFKHPLINYMFSDNSLGDAGKFLFLKNYKGYYLTVDDDLIFSKSYIKDMVTEIDEFGIVTHHGRSFTSFPIDSYYKTPTSKKVRCLSEEIGTGIVQFGGTGVMGFHTSIINPPIEIFKTSNMADIYFGLYAKSQNKYIWCLRHSKDYIKYQFVKDTIYDIKSNSDSFETEVINNYYTKCK